MTSQKCQQSFEIDGIKFCKPDVVTKPKKREEGKVMYVVYDTATRSKLMERQDYFIRNWYVDDTSAYESYILVDVYGREFYANSFISRVIKHLPEDCKEGTQLHIVTGKLRRFISAKTGEEVEYVPADVKIEKLPEAEKKDN